MTDEGELITVKIGVFSGRENPEFSLDETSADRFIELLRSILGGEPATPLSAPKLGEFYGFLISMPDKMARERGLPQAIEVRERVVTAETAREKQTSWYDGAGLLPFLVGLAYEAGHGEVLQEYEVERPKPQ